MKPSPVYSLLPIEPVQASGAWLWDSVGKKYLDLYGGHAVISIGHAHPHYVSRLEEQLKKISFYSNSVLNSLQDKLAEKLGELSGYPDYHLFLCNSGAEANENAVKAASFATGRKKVMAFTGAFHGRTSGAVALTDNRAIVSPFNAHHDIEFIAWNNIEELQKITSDIAAVIIEGIQGVAGIQVPDDEFLRALEKQCRQQNALLILDEIQSGYGRTGKFFYHQYADIKPDIITVAKGMGNGFPIGGVLFHPNINLKTGMLGTTFGGNHLACAAALAVLEVMEKEQLLAHVANVGEKWITDLQKIVAPQTVRGKGFMIGWNLPDNKKELRQQLVARHQIFTGEAKPNIIRLLPPLTLQQPDIMLFNQALHTEWNSH